MKHIHVHALFLASVLLTSCVGQNVGSENDLVNSGANDSTTFQEPASGVFGMKQDKRGTIWIAANNGIYRYDTRQPEGQGRSFSKITGKERSIRYSAVLEDRKGKLWFASLGSGVFYYDGKSLPNRQASLRNFTTRDGLASNEVICIYEDAAGNVWFGTPNGASRYDGKSFRNFTMGKSASRSDSVHVSVYQQRLPENSGLHNDVHAITQDKAGRLWFGTRGHTFIYDGKRFTTLTNTDGKPFRNVWCILEDRKGNIWFGADGLWRYNGNTFTKINETGGGVLVEDKKGNILASSGGSIFRYDEQSLSDEKPHVTEIKTGHGGLRNLPFGLLGADDGSIWFASKGGVSRYDGKTITSLR